MANDWQETYKAAHGLRLMSNLEDLFKGNIICDFTIQVGTTSFKVHRTILAACSDYFRSMLSDGIDEGIVYINGIEEEAIEQCVGFMYTGVADVTLENAKSILDAADMFKMDDLTELCYTYLKQNIAPENCLEIRDIINMYENVELKDFLEHFILENMRDVVETEGFQQLSKPDLMHYLKTCKRTASARCKSGPARTASTPRSRIFLTRPDSRMVKGRRIRSLRSAPVETISETQESVLWKGVLNWINYDVGQRKKELLPMFKFVKLIKFPLTFLSSTAWEDPLVQKSNSCKDMIISKVYSNIKDLKANISLRNCFNIYQMAMSNSSDDSKRVMDTAITYMANNLKALKNRNEVQLWKKEELCLFLRSCNSANLNEGDLWQTAMTWFEYDKDRKECVLDVVQALDVRSLTPQFVVGNILKESIVKESRNCVEYLARTVFHDPKVLAWLIDINTCFTLKYLARKYRDTIFADIGSDVLPFMINNFLKIIEQPDFRKISFEEIMQLCKIFRKRKIHGEAKWAAIMAWIKHDPNMRQKYLPSLLKTISFERLSSCFMKETVRQESLVYSSPECNRIVMNAVYDKLPC